MLYVATVHYGSPQWIEPQTRFLRRHLSGPHEIWASIEGIDPSYGRHFDRVISQYGGHAGKLNHLALEIGQVAADDDRLMFIDGDAFPIADPMPMIEESLRRYPLVAVRREENLHDRQPHPLFCVTTVGTWRALPGDWSEGFTWSGPRGGTVSDVGGVLLRTLELSGTPWLPITRTRSEGTNPVFFGVYGDLIYHHGASFRPGFLNRATREGEPRPLDTRVRLLNRAVNRVRRRRWERETRERYEAESRSLYRRYAEPAPQTPGS